MRGDLHCHTTLSDGSLGIEEIIVQAKRTDIDILSITDHDTLSSSSRAQLLGDRYGVKIIPGVELSAWDEKRNNKVHILCYAPQKPERLEGLCHKSCTIRKECGKEMINNVMQKYPIKPEAVLKYCTSSKSIFKQHIMRALIDYGYTTEFYGQLSDELFDRKTGSCIVTRHYPEVNFVLDLIHSSRGVAVLAHPYLYGNTELMEELVENGKLEGVEAFHYTANPQQQQELAKFCNDHNILATGGSDFHGLYNQCASPIGSHTTDEENLDKLMKLINANKK